MDKIVPTATLSVILPLIHHIANVAYPDVLTWYIRVTLQLLQHAAGLM